MTDEIFAVITGGGTSGHVIPAIAIAELIQDVGYEPADLHFVGSTTGVETQLFPSTQIPMSLLTVQGYSRQISLHALVKNFSTFRILRAATKHAILLLKALQPRVVISVGGYASVPTARAANKLGIPVVAVSYDRRPGLATKQQAKKAAACAVAYLPTDLPNATLTGAPVRRVFYASQSAQTKQIARHQLGLPIDRKIITVVGGSQGSAKLNSIARKIVETNRNRDDICVFHITGQRYFHDDQPQLAEDAKIIYRRIDSTIAIHDVYLASDLVVARAGASTVAEIATIGQASVLIPWKQASEDHQTANAKWLSDIGAAVLVDEDVQSVESIAKDVCELACDQNRLEQLSRLALKAGELHRDSKIWPLIAKIAGVSIRPNRVLELFSPQRIHVVGVGGPGMSAIATVLAQMGHLVSGSDIHESPIIERLRVCGVKINIGHQPDVVRDCDFVTGSPAIKSHNIEYKSATDLGIPVFTRAEVLSEICGLKYSVGVAGTHGKTTTTAMLTTILRKAGKNPNYLIGGDVNDFGNGAAWTHGDLFIVEADESDGTHLQLPLSAAILNNVDVDHLDHFETLDAIRKSFQQMMSKVAGHRVLCIDDPVCFELSKQMQVTTYATTYGESNQSASANSADFVASEIIFSNGSAQFVLEKRERDVLVKLGAVQLPLRGIHNVRNAVGAMTMAMQLGVGFAEASSAISDFRGVARRFDFQGSSGGVTYVDDYAHLPNEISSVIAGARDNSDKWERLVAVFQPNRFNRMSRISNLYSDAFVGADLVVVTDIYSSGTEPIAGVTGELVVDAIRAANPDQRIVYIAKRQELVEFLANELRSGDLCISMGCGDIATLPRELIALAKSCDR